MNVLQIQQITFAYNTERTFISDLSLTIRRGEFVTLAGLNGAGKTTLIRIAATLLVPDKGNCVYFENAALKKRDIRRRLGYAAQETALYPDYSVLENLRLFAGLYGLKRKTARERIHQLTELLQLEEHLSTRIVHCSGGTRRKTHLAVSMLHQPELLILDEPTAGIDVKTAQVIMKSLRSLAREGMAILCAVHSLDEILAYSGRVLVLKQGQLAKEMELPQAVDGFGQDDRQLLKQAIIASL